MKVNLIDEVVAIYVTFRFACNINGVCNMFTFNIVSHYFQFSFSFQDIPKVC